MFDLTKFIRDEYVINSASDALEAVFAVRDQWNEMNIPYDLRDFLTVTDAQWHAIYEALKPSEKDVTYPTFNVDTVTYDDVAPYLEEGYMLEIRHDDTYSEFLHLEGDEAVYSYTQDGESGSFGSDKLADRPFVHFIKYNDAAVIQVVPRENE
jgi:hypothetical protein